MLRSPMRPELRPWLALVALAVTTCGPTGASSRHPTFPDGGLLAGAAPVPAASLGALRGTWTVGAGTEAFGEVVAAGSTARTASTSSTVSLFAARNEAYVVLRAGCLAGGTELVLEGYWRYAASSDTGLVRLFAGPPDAARALCEGATPATALSLDGAFGEGSELPDTPLALGYRAGLKEEPERTFHVVAHRGGCRTSDDCGASENSLEVLRMAESLGADAVEVDVRLTADGVPILYHDEDFSSRLVEGEYCRGPVEAFTFAHVRALCRLRFGEEIPTLEAAMRTLVEETTLRGLWLDVKRPAAVAPAAELAREYMDLAAAEGRHASIVTGLGERDVYDAFVGAGLVGRARCLTELEPEDVHAADCRIFAPRWTRGPMPETVQALQAEGRIVAFWTLDEVDFIDAFLREAVPNALLTNRPGVVFHRFQMLGTLPPPAPEP